MRLPTFRACVTHVLRRQRQVMCFDQILSLGRAQQNLPQVASSMNVLMTFLVVSN